MGADKLVLCLITGPSGSGKTSMALELLKNLLGNPLLLSDKPDAKRSASVIVIHQDFYFTKPFLPYKNRIDDSYENSSGIDWDSLLADVDSGLTETSGEETDNTNKLNCGINGIGDVGVKIVIVEGHLLGDAAAHFRRRILERKNIGVVTVLLKGCSQETCRRRRLERKKDRSEVERKELASYIDTFVWPSYLKYGIHAMDSLRRELVGLEMANRIDKDVHCPKPHSGVLIEISNSDGASLEAHSETISNQIYSILQD